MCAGGALAQAQLLKITDAEVMNVHQSAILIDTHNDVTSKTVTGFDIGKADTESHTDRPRLRAGGVSATFFAAYVAPSYRKTNASAHRAFELIDTVWHDIVGKHSNNIVLARTAAEVESAHKQGKLPALIGIEGGHAIENSLRLLRAFYQLGVRYMTLTHTNTNDWADSSGDPDQPKINHHNGLTNFGKAVAQEMNRIGMIVDVSHVSDKAFWDVLEVSKALVFASHSSCYALSNIARNMKDDMIVAMGMKGGVIQINFGCEFVSQKSADASKAIGGHRRMAETKDKFKIEAD